MARELSEKTLKNKEVINCQTLLRSTTLLLDLQDGRCCIVKYGLPFSWVPWNYPSGRHVFFIHGVP